MRKINQLVILALLLTMIGVVYGRNYASQQARFVSPDPIALTNERIVDPQQLNLYSYARTNPLLYIDPLGLDITLTGSAGDQDVYKNWLQGSISSFNINVDSSGKVGIDGKVDPTTLTGNDKRLYDEITDTNNHVGITLTRNDPSVLFGRFDGGGKQTIDLTDIARLGGPNNKGGLSGNDVVAHETYEPYSSLLQGLTNVSDAATVHQSITSFFPGFQMRDKINQNVEDTTTKLIVFQITHAKIQGGPLNNTKVNFYFKLNPPLPPNPPPLFVGGNLSNVRVIP